ncbi:ATP-binding protein [Mucilaginibacter sp.]|jgi:signal transduction histidine kinase/CheY-like chemotaxis protein|uniref:ATP-binding protein n=1 Tax=Mucilaginibacter sp. TaxID=1882438 RepID=UPI002C9B0AB9|nr:ATP-binding protein [Mucilaginibacter sp.]HTI57898.1 ATP-binding protein [Mucilaginibacter sp.]
MNRDVGFFNFSVNKILTREQTILDQARIRLLYYGLWLAIIAVSALVVNIYLDHQYLLAFTTLILLVSFIILFKYLTFRPRWGIISHILLVMATVVNLTNVFITLQTVDIITAQIVLLIIIFSFYMLGQVSGMFYSLMNLIPVLLFLILEYDNNYVIGIKPMTIDESTIIIAVCANFILIIFMHSHFYTAFIKSMKQLRATAEERGNLNVELEKVIEKAEKSAQAKSEFLSIMSHEIRTPLNAVIGMGNLLMMGNPRPDQKDNLDILKFSANNLLALVNDVLDFNKIEAGKVVFENIKFKIPDLMQNVCGGLRLKAEEKELEFRVSIDNSLKNKIVIGDPTRLTQIIFNLISNAIKFTPSGNVWVNVKCVEDRHNIVNVNFSVKDTGIGIEKESLATIFEPFTQESISTTRQYGGTGLGLAIVKRLLELQGLHMEVQSTLGEGSEFSFDMEFPVSTEVAPVPEENDQPESVTAAIDSISQLRVLIAEDNMVNVMLMKKLFSKWGITPTIAENGERAIEMVQYGNFDIILMDLQMPVLNGFDAATEIRKMRDPRKANIPIIALTASALFDIKERVFNSGMNDYVSKPFKPDELKEKIQNLVATIS